MSSIILKIDALIEKKSLLKHPFYEKWSEGNLSIPELAGYSKEYYQIVKEVPNYVKSIMPFAPLEMQDSLKQNSQEEEDHILPWADFAKSLGVSETELMKFQAEGKTKKAIIDLENLMQSLAGGAAAMYAFEKEIPKISETKIEGLKKFYGINDPVSLNYFVLHQEADIRHAAVWEKILLNFPEKSSEKILEAAEKSLDAQNLLLDSCFEKYC